VSQLTLALQQTLARDPVFGQAVRVEGELSNVRPSSRGHIYFTLKDDFASLNGVMWASRAKTLPFTPEDGMQVVATGKVDIYPPSGSYSLVVERLEPQGIGALQLAYDQLKARLEAEGLFASHRKRPLPFFPNRLGLVTSQTGAVIHDMLRVIRRKNPRVHILLYPVPVQGAGAAEAIARGIATLNQPGYGVDVVLLARGGGSFEDLFCFSEEPVVRAIADSRLPVITGIGHEPDFTLADAVADCRAATPTAAAELAVPDLGHLAQQLAQQQARLQEALEGLLWLHAQRLAQSADTLVRHQRQMVDRHQERWAHQRQGLQQAIAALLLRHQEQWTGWAAALEAWSPLGNLKRGWAVAYNRSGAVINQVGPLALGDSLRVVLSDGALEALVSAIHPSPPPA
jgi:exodeoxyribonuclease VII large subunit